MSDEFNWWRSRLTDDRQEPIPTDQPQSGFYKMRKGKDGPWLPVMIRIDQNGVLACRVADERRDPFDVWSWCAGNPVSQADAKHAFEYKTWPGDAPSIGDNSGDVGLVDQLRDYMETARAWLTGRKIADQNDADQAANFRNEITRLKGRVDKERDAKVRPHLDAQKDINAEYKPIISDAEDLTKQFLAANTAFLKAEKARQEAEQRARYEAERKAAEDARRKEEAERAEREKSDPIAVLTEPEPAPVELPTPPAPVKVQAGGQRGKRMGLKTITVYDITDYAKALEWASGHPDVVAAVEKVCRMAARTGEQVPGVKVRTEEVAA